MSTKDRATATDDHRLGSPPPIGCVIVWTAWAALGVIGERRRATLTNVRA